MNKRHYKWFTISYYFNEKLDRKLTTLGMTILSCTFLLLFFGLNTRLSMLFVVFSMFLALITVDLISLSLKSFDYKIERFLPSYISKGHTLKYSVTLRAENAKSIASPLFYKEIPTNPLPTFEVFDSTKEPNEEKRNAYDRYMGYYRWKWLIEQNCGGEYSEIEVSNPKMSNEVTFMATFIPKVRGKISFKGAYIFQKGIFGLFKKGKVIESIGDFLVFPEIVSLNKPVDFNDGSNSGNEKIYETEEKGSGFELKSLRDFSAGDSLRNIHWKASAKAGHLMTKEFYKEVDAGSIMFIDNFFKEHYLNNFETILSAAVSILNEMYEADNLPQFLIIGTNYIEIEQTSKENLLLLLSNLALAENDSKNDLNAAYTLFQEQVKQTASIFFLTPSYDERRYRFVESLLKLQKVVSIFFSGERKTSGKIITYEYHLKNNDFSTLEG